MTRCFVALSLVAVGCATTTRPSDAGFVVYTAASGGLRTHIVYVEHRADRPDTASFEGLWALDDSRDPPWLGAASSAGICGACPTACGTSPRPFKAPDRVHAGNDTCGDPSFQSFVAGTLYGSIETHSDTCMTGLNLYGGEVVWVDLFSAAWRPPRAKPGAGWCVEAGEAGVVPQPDDVCIADGDVWARRDGESCDACRDDFNDETPYLASGLLTTVSEAWSGVDASPAAQRVNQSPISPAQCPGPGEPCGEPGVFAKALSAPLEDDAPYRHPSDAPFWVATSGDVALAVEEGRFMVWTRDAEPRPVDLDANEVIGVRFHASVGPLLDRACAVACSPRWCAATFPDADCPPALDDEQRDCTYGMGRADGEEGDSEGSEEGPAVDEPTAPPVDARSASALGNDCFTHLKAGDLVTAERECTLALERADNDRTRGAVLFNLGLIAERRGDRVAARAFFERSVKARPNKAVQKRLDALR